ncbi:MAG: hypothetical protein MUE81_05955 [Thermoflexibacter sp.]|nr:hypothetical protein [Thermoflexibacter sp.]
MKKLSLNEMEQIQGGGAFQYYSQRLCYGYSLWANGIISVSGTLRCFNFRVINCPNLFRIGCILLF